MASFDLPVQDHPACGGRPSQVAAVVFYAGKMEFSAHFRIGGEADEDQVVGQVG